MGAVDKQSFSLEKGVREKQHTGFMKGVKLGYRGRAGCRNHSLCESSAMGERREAVAALVLQTQGLPEQEGFSKDFCEPFNISVKMQ